MTLALGERGWQVGLVTAAGRAVVGMAFEGATAGTCLIAEQRLPGHHNYFVGCDPERWRTHVPRFASVRYEELYPGIDVRVREADGVPEYDLLLAPRADLAAVVVQVTGARGLALTADGALVIETELGPLTQPRPKTWQVDDAGRRTDVPCRFRLLGRDRFGFVADDWDGASRLTIDPGLIWSTFLGGAALDMLSDVHVDADGRVTVTGYTHSSGLPITNGAFDPLYSAGEAYVSQFDPSQTGAAQLVYSTYLGGGSEDVAEALEVDKNGIVTICGNTQSGNFPVTQGAYDTTQNGASDGFVTRLDPSKRGTAQLVYSTFLGGDRYDYANDVALTPFGVIAVTGNAWSTNFPTTRGAYDTSYNGGNRDAFACLLDPSKKGSAQLTYSTYLGGKSYDWLCRIAVDPVGVMTITGETWSTDFPTTVGAYDRTYAGGNPRPGDVFVSRIDPNRAGAAQLVYSTLIGGDSGDTPAGISVDGKGVVTLVGGTWSAGYPTTPGAYDRTHSRFQDAFVTRLDPSKRGAAQLIYSTLLGGRSGDLAVGMDVDERGVVTLSGSAHSSDFPTTANAFDRTHNGSNDAFVSRIDPSRSGAAQLVYSTFLGGGWADYGRAVAVDGSGTATVAGFATSPGFPTTAGAFDTTHNSGGRWWDGFVSRVDMGRTFYADRHALSHRRAGRQTFTLEAGAKHANLAYAIFGSMTGTRPGVTLSGVHVPLNVDPYTMFTLNPSPPMWVAFRGTLDRQGRATAAFQVPSGLPTLPRFTLHHAYVVLSARGVPVLASNAVPLTLDN